MKEYRCTRNAPYAHDCTGRDDLRERQGYYIKADSPELAWKEMAIRFPEDVEFGFTVHEWKSFDVKVVEVTQEENGDIKE